MLCPRCNSSENRVIDSRTSRGGRAVRRRRECTVCASRFTTYEFVEEPRLQVRKRGGSYESFDREKLIRAVETACAKRPVSQSAIEGMVEEVEEALLSQTGAEVPSAWIGERVMELLKPLDRVAYVRFASVYRDFQDEGEFQDFVVEMQARGRREEERRHQPELPL